MRIPKRTKKNKSLVSSTEARTSLDSLEEEMCVHVSVSSLGSQNFTCLTLA
jgi:hypothetical protein